jgi:hypothetical protein
VACTWTASTNPQHAKYVLLRTTTGAQGRALTQSPDALSFSDTTAAPGVTYGYRVISLRGDGTVESHSNLVTIGCCRP